MSWACRCLKLLLALVVLPSTACAHVLDEYLQATLVEIEPSDIRLQINLTPGVDVAQKVLAQIDRDGDGVISSTEATAYAQSLKRDLIARLDGREIELKLTASNYPEPAELRTGSGIIQIEFSIVPGALAAGPHRLTVENRHFPTLGVYLFNAAQPRSGSVQITQQKRNLNQSEGEIAFTYSPMAQTSRAVAIGALVAVIAVIAIAAVWTSKRSSARAATSVPPATPPLPTR
ncbi:MAG TPA: hypothetical protein VH370_12490 [Humisphaera sp.]|nr:hypothetical protein [Humisphaera sp.]